MGLKFVEEYDDWGPYWIAGSSVTGNEYKIQAPPSAIGFILTVSGYGEEPRLYPCNTRTKAIYIANWIEKEPAIVYKWDEEDQKRRLDK